MRKKEARKEALEIIWEQIDNAGYSLERSEYESMKDDDIELIREELWVIKKQFEKRYKDQFR